MIKIGILTFHRAHNFGAVLQAYALQSTLKNKGHDVEIIDYWPKYRNAHYALFNFKNILLSSKNNNSITSNIKEGFKEITGFPYRFLKHFKFSSFIKNNFRIKNNFYYSGADIPEKYDVIICGSDQIWRYNFRGNMGFDEVYFAKYPVNKKTVKLSYAASMGDKDFDENALKIFSKLIKNFDLISVREDAMQALVEPNASPVMVVDPVFLLSENEWRKMVKRNVNKRRYLLFYQLLKSEEADNIAKKIAKERQLELIEIRGASGIINPFERKNLKHSVGPIDFITLIAHADYVVSTSYHGVAFSIIFQKQFYALGFENKGYRINSLLKSLGIKQGFINSNSNNYDSEINYDRVNFKLEEMIKFSKSFLESSVKKRDYITSDIIENEC